mmetsp:Transcript_18554/g.37910  ORF Transcript_18554/g.37910 Transcript_18554/m.37910 type:complete len:206 (+) Transcript_18554:478-1095(+)
MSEGWPSSPFSPSLPSLCSLFLIWILLLLRMRAAAWSCSALSPFMLLDRSIFSPGAWVTINWEVLGRLTTCPPGSCTSSSFANPTPLSSTVTGILATVVSLPSTGTMPETASSFFSSVPSVMAGVGPGVSSSSESLPSPPRPLAAFHSSSESSSVTTEASEGVSASLIRRDLGDSSSPVASSLMHAGGSGSVQPLGMYCSMLGSS